MKLNPNDALAILGYLKDEGVISEEQIEHAITKAPSEDLKAAAIYIHIIFCISIHEDCECGFLREDMIEDTWQCEHHVRWLWQTEKIRDKLNITTENFLREISEFNAIFQGMKDSSPAVQYLFRHYWKRVFKNEEGKDEKTM